MDSDVTDSLGIVEVDIEWSLRGDISNPFLVMMGCSKSLRHHTRLYRK